MKHMVVLFSLFVMGCQHPVVQTPPLGERDAAMMSMWDVYQHCLTQESPELLRQDVERLYRAATEPPDRVSPLPAVLNRFVSKQPLRVTFDLRALAAFCALRAAQRSELVGEIPEAIRLYQSLLVRFEDLDYAYYREQASLAAVRLERTRATNWVIHPVVSH